MEKRLASESAMTLPCHHEERVTNQVEPAIQLLTQMDTLHPDVLVHHGIQPQDYHSGLVFRSAIESIRGTFIASSTRGREGMVNDVLENLHQRSMIAGYEYVGNRDRHDFTVVIQEDPGYFAALEVKGGEGNSINISSRPIWAREFGVWSHLDGAIVHQPAHGALSILNRLTNEMVRRGKQVDVLFFKDILCGTRTRPCPKYPGREHSIGLGAAPDVFLFPSRIPTREDPTPPVHELESLRLPTLVLRLFGILEAELEHHLWRVEVSVEDVKNSRLKRVVTVTHDGKVVGESASHSWRE
jgi:hypothetical protein